MFNIANLNDLNSGGENRRCEGNCVGWGEYTLHYSATASSSLYLELLNMVDYA